MAARVWLITGASSGIGLTLAEYVLSQGDKVIATVRSLAKFPESLKAAGAHPLVLDLGASDSDILKAGEEALKVHGYIDVLVNNAGYGGLSPVEELDLGEARAQFQTNVFGAIALIQALLPSFRARRTGHILNVSSVGGFVSFPSWGAYCASKSALEAFSESLSQEVAPFGIRVLIVQPGYFPTSFLQTTASISDLKRSTVYTDPSQGYGADQKMHERAVEQGHVGDVAKLAQRLYELVAGTGLAKSLVEGQGGKRDWLRVPLGPDCGTMILQKLSIVTENVKAFEHVWRSTDVTPERLKELA
ncbi:hypothetical protein IEO21_07614 [Rhodonia placenta]|uniref:Ketoreductase domain-containing protein n=1 Tax=Rhodonia placenta TaxID=104341 RepID=A0A8H7TZH6_9APHY|nr:hypothetical protein IEO21_07614 [Postia placenta]